MTASSARRCGPRSAQVALIAGVGAGGRPLPEPLRGPGGATVHLVPPALSWERLARVACLVAAASPAGAEPVQLRRAVAGHVLLVSVRDRLARMERTRAWRERAARLMAVLPVATAVLVLVVGIGLALRSLTGGV